MRVLVFVLLSVSVCVPAQTVQPTGPEETAKVVAAFFEAARKTDADALEAAAVRVVACGVEAVDPVLEGLARRTATEITWGLRCLKQIGEARGAETFLELCKHEKAEVRAEALATGVALVGEVMAPAVLEGVRDPDLQVRRRAFDGLLALPSPTGEIAALAVAALVDPDFWIASRAARLLASLPPPPEGGSDPLRELVPAVLPRLDQTAATRLFRVLARRCGKESAVYVEQALDRGSSAAKVCALAAAADLGLDEFREAARRLLRAPEQPVQAAAAGYLARRMDKAGVPALIQLLESARDEKTRTAAAVALRQITGQLFGFDVAAWRAWLRDR